MRSIFICAFIFIACSQQAYATDPSAPKAPKETVTWQVVHWPPWMMMEGEDQGKGRFNHILKVAHENLPQYNNITREMNWARFWHDVKDGKNVCNMFAFKSGSQRREEIVYFSEPHTFVLPNAIIMKKSTIEKLGNPSSYPIVELLKDERFKGTVEKTRSFTETLDDILKKQEQGSNLSREGVSPESLIKMVASGRIDYTIEYPIVATYFGQKLTKDFGSISSIPITEMEPFAYVYLACTKNEWGKKVIERWNVVLRRIKPTQEYRLITEIGHTDENELRIIRQNYDAFVNAQ